MKKLYELCYGIEPEERDLLLLEIKHQRLLDNGYSNKEANKILIDTKLNIENYEHKDSILNEEDPIYRHHELQIHSKPGGFDPATCTVIKRPYYLEMKCRYTIDNLLDYYYTKLIVPPLFRDNKRDIGAMNHLLNSFKSPIISSVDFLLFVIDFVLSTKLELVNREDVLL